MSHYKSDSHCRSGDRSIKGFSHYSRTIISRRDETIIHHRWLVFMNEDTLLNNKCTHCRTKNRNIRAQTISHKTLRRSPRGEALMFRSNRCHCSIVFCTPCREQYPYPMWYFLLYFHICMLCFIWTDSVQCRVAFNKHDGRILGECIFRFSLLGFGIRFILLFQR